MSLKHTWATTIKNDAGASVATDSPLIVTGESEENFYIEVPATETLIVELAITVADIVSGFLFSDRATTINTNDSAGATGQTIVLSANQAYAWNSGMPYNCPFTPDITAFYITNDHATLVAKVRGGFLIQHTA